MQAKARRVTASIFILQHVIANTKHLYTSSLNKNNTIVPYDQ